MSSSVADATAFLQTLEADFYADGNAFHAAASAAPIQSPGASGAVSGSGTGAGAGAASAPAARSNIPMAPRHLRPHRRHPLCILRRHRMIKRGRRQLCCLQDRWRVQFLSLVLVLLEPKPIVP